MLLTRFGFLLEHAASLYLFLDIKVLASVTHPFYQFTTSDRKELTDESIHEH